MKNKGFIQMPVLFAIISIGMLLVIPILVFATSDSCYSYLYHVGCKDEYDLADILDDLAARGLIFSGTRNQVEAKCKTEIQEYEIKKAIYEACIKSQQEALLAQCPLSSSYDSSLGKCQCYTGYIMRDNQCITYTEDCKRLYGNNIYGVKGDNKSDCYCDFGYEWNVSKTACVKTITCFLNSTKINNICVCNTGYEWNTSQTACVKSLICPFNSTKIGYSCICNEGYIMRNSQCISYTEDCIIRFGQNAWGTKGNNGSTCYCNTGYEWNTSQTVCIQSIVCPQNSAKIANKCICNDGYMQKNNQCITYTEDCVQNFGQNVYGVKGDSNSSSCYCSTGYQWNEAKTACIVPVCQLNATRIGGTCTCNDGYVNKNSQCITYTEDCRLLFGNNAVGRKGNTGNSLCDCEAGYTWNKSRTACEKIEIKPIQLPAVIVPTKVNEIMSPEIQGTSTIQGTVLDQESSDQVTTTTSQVEEPKIQIPKQGKIGFFGRIFRAVGNFFSRIF